MFRQRVPQDVVANASGGEVDVENNNLRPRTKDPLDDIRVDCPGPGERLRHEPESRRSGDFRGVQLGQVERGLVQGQQNQVVRRGGLQPVANHRILEGVLRQFQRDERDDRGKQREDNGPEQAEQRYVQ